MVKYVTVSSKSLGYLDTALNEQHSLCARVRVRGNDEYFFHGEILEIHRYIDWFGLVSLF